MAVLVTGAAGFIGMHTSLALLARGEQVIGFDDLNNYYPVRLKEERLAQLLPHKNFHFVHASLVDKDAVKQLFTNHPKIQRIVHLGAQAGVRYSLENPHTYIDANVMGQVNMLEAARGRIEHMVYASSSSVYGGNKKMPFSVDDPVGKPISVYAASKRAGELLAYTYAHLYKLPLTGLRFFTVYGPWGRPDMAAYLFANAITSGQAIKVFNNGQMRRDFTYVDDIVRGIIAALDRIPQPDSDGVPQAIYNLGNNQPELLMDFIATLEKALGIKAILDLQPIQPGDVPETYADITSSQRDLGFQPTTPISQGLENFVAWYRQYDGAGLVGIAA